MLPTSSFFSTKLFTHFSLAIIMLYLILQKQIEQLKKSGIFLLILMILFLLIILIHYLTFNNESSPKVNLLTLNLNLKSITSFPTLATSFSIHPSFFTSFNTLTKKTSKNGMRLWIISYVLLFCVYITSSLIHMIKTIQIFVKF